MVCIKFHWYDRKVSWNLDFKIHPPIKMNFKTTEIERTKKNRFVVKSKIYSMACGCSGPRDSAQWVIWTRLQYLSPKDDNLLAWDLALSGMPLAAFTFLPENLRLQTRGQANTCDIPIPNQIKTGNRTKLFKNKPQTFFDQDRTTKFTFLWLIS